MFFSLVYHGLDFWGRLLMWELKTIQLKLIQFQCWPLRTLLVPRTRYIAPVPPQGQSNQRRLFEVKPFYYSPSFLVTSSGCQNLRTRQWNVGKKRTKTAQKERDLNGNKKFLIYKRYSRNVGWQLCFIPSALGGGCLKNELVCEACVCVCTY